MFFIKPKPSFQDVIDFCNLGVSEGIHLDYKRDLSNPRNIAKTMCAFANTQGGTIIVGVDDDNNKPKKPVIGLDYKEKLETQVLDIMLGNIYNPLTLDIHVCEPVNNRTFIIINIPESHKTPHAVDNDTKIYIRTGDISQPEKLEQLADSRRIEWLISGRKKSEDFRENIKKEAWFRFVDVCRIKKQKLSPPYIYASAIPLFPREVLASHKKIKDEIIIKLDTHNADFYLFHQLLPEINTLPVPNGIISDYPSDHKIFEHYEINQFGFLSAFRDIAFLNNQDTIFCTLKNIDLFIFAYLEALSKFYKELNFYGLVQFRIELAVKNIAIRYPDDRDGRKIPIDNTIKYEKKFNSSLLNNEVDKEGLLLDIIKEINWYVGYSDTTDEKIKELILANKRG